MEDMTSNVRTISEKLEQEAKLAHVAYEVGDFYIQAQALGNDRFVSMFDKSFTEIAKESYDSSLTATETINQFCEKYDFEGVANLMNRTATMLDSQNFFFNRIEMRDKETVSVANEQEFQDPVTPQFTIFRLKDTEQTAQLKEESLESLTQLGITPDKSNYECLYTNDLEELMMSCFEVMDEQPDMFHEEFENALYNNLDYDNVFTMNHYGLFDSDVIGVQYEGNLTYFYNNDNGLVEIDFEALPPNIKLKSVEQEEPEISQKMPQENTPENPKNDMVMDVYQKSDKLTYEKNSLEVVYQAGDFFVEASLGFDGSDVTLYDSNLAPLRTISYENIDNLTEAINQFCHDVQFDGIDTLHNRSADMLNHSAFHEKYDETYERRESSMYTSMEWYSNPEDSFAIYTLNPTEHNEQLHGRDMAFLEKLGEHLDKRNFSCVYTDTVASLQQNDPLFYGDTDMAEHLNQALSELEQGDGEKLLTMLHVKSPKMGELAETMSTGCVLALKQDGEVSHYFMEDNDLQKVEFMNLPPKFTEKSVEEAKDQMHQEIYDNTRTISDFVERQLSSFDQSCINILVDSAVEMNPEASKKDILLFVGDAINDGFILPKDFRNMDIPDFVGAVADLDRNNLIEFSSVIPDVSVLLQDVTPKQLVEMMSSDHNIENLVHQASQLSNISQNLEVSVPFEDISVINDFAQEISMKYEDMDKQSVCDFISEAIDNQVISVQDLENISYRDFFDAFQQEDMAMLGELVQMNQDSQEKEVVSTINPTRTYEERELTSHEKLQQEAVLNEVAYQVGDNSLYFKVDDNDITFAVFDKNLDQVELGTYENMSLTEGINEFVNTHDLPDIDQLADRESPLLHVDTLVYEAIERSHQQEEKSEFLTFDEVKAAAKEELSYAQVKAVAQGELNPSQETTTPQEQADIVAMPNEDYLFSATLTTQERVIIESATDFAYDYLSNYSQEEREVMSDILDKISVDGNLLQYYPDDYVFEDRPELSEKTTIVFTDTELEMIGEVCDATSQSWDNITNDYRDLVDAVIYKVEHPQKEVVEEILPNVGNLAEEPQETPLDTVMSGNKEYHPTQENLERLATEGYAEIAYVDYTDSAQPHQGTEDFSAERWQTVSEKSQENTQENTPRIVAGSYEITDSLVMGGEEIAVGESPSGMAGTWERSIVADESKGIVDNWYSGHYFDTKEEAVEDFHQRIEDKLEERAFIHGDKSMYAEKPEDKGEKKEDKVKEEKKERPRESVLNKLKEIKNQIAKKEEKEQPSKGKTDQTL